MTDSLQKKNNLIRIPYSYIVKDFFIEEMSKKRHLNES